MNNIKEFVLKHLNEIIVIGVCFISFILLFVASTTIAYNGNVFKAMNANALQVLFGKKEGNNTYYFTVAGNVIVFFIILLLYGAAIASLYLKKYLKQYDQYVCIGALLLLSILCFAFKAYVVAALKQAGIEDFIKLYPTMYINGGLLLLASIYFLSKIIKEKVGR